MTPTPSLDWQRIGALGTVIDTSSPDRQIAPDPKAAWRQRYMTMLIAFVIGSLLAMGALSAVVMQ